MEIDSRDAASRPETILEMSSKAGNVRPGSTRSGDMPTLKFFDAMSGPTSSRVIPTATELSTTMVDPGLTYFSTVAMALRRYVVSTFLSSVRIVGTEMRTCVAWLISAAFDVN